MFSEPQSDHKRYQLIWEMANKLRDVIGKRDEHCKLNGETELDDAFFTTEIPIELKSEPLKRERGSQKKTKVLVITESPKSETKPQKGQSTEYKRHKRSESRHNYREGQRAGSRNGRYGFR